MKLTANILFGRARQREKDSGTGILSLSRLKREQIDFTAAWMKKCLFVPAMLYIVIYPYPDSSHHVGLGFIHLVF